jgi:hypothetical protein
MRKRLISLVAAAALVGGMVAAGTAQAGTIATSGDTNISMYGFVRADLNWAKKLAGGNSYSSNVAEKSGAAGAEGAKQNKTNFNATTRWTRIGLKLNTPDIGVSGLIEADFAGTCGDKAFRLRRAYLQHDLDNYFIRVGKDINLLKQSTYSWNLWGMPGFGHNDPFFTVQARVGGTFDLGSVTLIPEIAAQEMKNVVVSGSGVSVNRTTMPGVAAKLTAKVKTFFGSPITAYAGYGYEQVKLEDAVGDEKKKSPQIVTAGVAVPINWITLKGDYNYFKGATAEMGLSNSKNAPSFYYDGGDLKYTKGHSIQGEVKITPIPQFAAWGGYALTKVKDADKIAGGVVKSVVKKNTGWFVGAGWKTTKVTQIALEYDRFKTTYQDSSTDSHKDKGSQYRLTFKYSF